MTDAEPRATDPAVGSAAEELVSRLIARGWTVAVAESLTGGLLVSSLVSVPGASATVRGGVVAYATALKNSLLGVDAALLAAEGAVYTKGKHVRIESAEPAPVQLDGDSAGHTPLEIDLLPVRVPFIVP